MDKFCEFRQMMMTRGVAEASCVSSTTRKLLRAAVQADNFSAISDAGRSRVGALDDDGDCALDPRHLAARHRRSRAAAEHSNAPAKRGRDRSHDDTGGLRPIPSSGSPPLLAPTVGSRTLASRRWTRPC